MLNLFLPGVVFTPDGSFSLAQNTLSGKAQNAVFRLNSYLYKFTDISPNHRLELFDKLVAPIMNYSAEVWEFAKQIKQKLCIYNSVNVYCE